MRERKRLNCVLYSRWLQDERRRLEPNEAVTGALGGVAILAGGAMAGCGAVVVVPAIAGYHKGVGAAISALLVSLASCCDSC